MSDHSTTKPEEDRQAALNKLRSATSVSMDPELFEKLYLSPPTKVHGDLRKTFGNPTPIGIGGFSICIAPLACDLMGWRGAGGNGAATIGAFFFMAGVLHIITGVLEWILGNSFPSIVFSLYGGFWLAFAATLIPGFAAYSTYSPDPSTPAAGLSTKGFNASFAFWLLFMGVLTLVFLICALRTNIAFFLLFFTLLVGVLLLTGAFFLNADDIIANAAVAKQLTVGSGAALFACAFAGWWIFASLMLAIVDFPIQLPLGDLSHVIRGKSESSPV